MVAQQIGCSQVLLFFSCGDCGRWVVYRLTGGGAFRSWAARWLLSGGAPAVDVLCAVVAVAVEEGTWRRAVYSYALNDVVFGNAVRIDADELLRTG